LESDEPLDKKLKPINITTNNKAQIKKRLIFLDLIAGRDSSLIIGAFYPQFEQKLLLLGINVPQFEQNILFLDI